MTADRDTAGSFRRARDCGCTVVYLPGLALRKAADLLYPGKSKTDARDAFIIAETIRAMPHTLRPLTGTARCSPR